MQMLKYVSETGSDDMDTIWRRGNRVWCQGAQLFNCVDTIFEVYNIIFKGLFLSLEFFSLERAASLPEICPYMDNTKHVMDVTMTSQ